MIPPEVRNAVEMPMICAESFCVGVAMSSYAFNAFSSLASEGCCRRYSCNCN